MIQLSRRKRKKPLSIGQRLGTAAVEFAVVSPIMILLTMGMMEMGRVVMVQQILVNASREGARLAILPGTTTSEVVSQVTTELGNQTISGATVTTIPSDLSTAVGGTAVTVQVSIPAANISWIPNPVYTANSTLQAETTMRRESS